MSIKYKTNQSGMASIMFAMLMIIIVTLLSIGFAVLVRNDQRQTLDKTLSNQASYAAESAINLKLSALRLHRGMPPGDPNAEENLTECDHDTNLVNGPPLFSNMPDVKITCLTWSAIPTKLAYNAVGTTPAVAVLKPANAGDTIRSILITWKPAATGPSVDIPMSPLDTNNLNLAIYPSLRIAAIKDNALQDTSVIFANPNTDDSDFVNIIASANSNMPAVASRGADIKNAQCSNTLLRLETANLCAMWITNLPGGSWDNTTGGRLSISSLGKNSDINVYAFGSDIKVKYFAGSGNSVAIPIKDAQFMIDVTAKSQDVIKRIVSNTSIESTTWRPGFVALADTLCKNYRVTGSTGSTGNNIAPGAVVLGEPTHSLCQYNQSPTLP
jgi:type II secretory pathway pseudopilin PulG